MLCYSFLFFVHAHFLSLHPFFVFQLGLFPCTLCTPKFINSHTHLCFTLIVGLFYNLVAAPPPLINTPHLFHVSLTNYSCTFIFCFSLSSFLIKLFYFILYFFILFYLFFIYLLFIYFILFFYF